MQVCAYVCTHANICEYLHLLVFNNCKNLNIVMKHFLRLSYFSAIKISTFKHVYKYIHIVTPAFANNNT